jgi:D-sedoheptulose 7-phosphate isomerase
MTELIKKVLRESCDIKLKVMDDERLLKVIQDVMEVCIDALKNGNKLLLAGNGGSASDAQHIAAELVGRYERDRKGLPALALTTNSSQLTAIANDYGYDDLFQRQVQALSNKGDVFFGLSTSGNSKNVVNAIKECKQQGVISVGMTGQSGGQMASLCDYCINVPADNTARIQEVHITIGHIVCSGIEAALFPG